MISLLTYLLTICSRLFGADLEAICYGHVCSAGHAQVIAQNQRHLLNRIALVLQIAPIAEDIGLVFFINIYIHRAILPSECNMPFFSKIRTGFSGLLPIDHEMASQIRLACSGLFSAKYPIGRTIKKP